MKFVNEYRSAVHSSVCSQPIAHQFLIASIPRMKLAFKFLITLAFV